MSRQRGRTRPGHGPRVLHVLAGAGVGGTERQLLLLLPHLAERVDTSLLIIRGGPLTERYAAAVPTRTLAKHGKVDPLFLTRLVAAVRAERPDVVQTWGTTANVWAALAARLARVPRLVVTEGALDEWKGRVHRTVDRRVYGWADALVCNSRLVADFLVGHGADPQRTRVVPNAVPLPRTAGSPDPAGVVLYLGRLHPVKGADVLVEALPAVVAAVPGSRFVIAGPAAQPAERALAARLQQRVAELGLGGCVDLPGPVEDPGELLRTARLLVVPSRSEGSPNVVVEAMAAGVPVVATSVGGVPELVDPGQTGLLVPPDDPAALADAVIATLRDPAAAAARAARARQVVTDRHALPAVVDAWLGLYRELCPQPAAAVAR